MSWNNYWLALDTETTGFTDTARILEIALVLFERGEVKDRWSQLLCPEGVDWENKNVLQALEVNKIKREDLVGKPTFGQVLDEVLNRLASQMVWVAHNADFDLRMIRQELARLGDYPLPASLVLDTMSLDQRINKTPITKGAHTVSSVAARWGVVVDGTAHRAETDAVTCGQILRRMMAREAIPGVMEHAETFQKEATAQWAAATKRGGRR